MIKVGDKITLNFHCAGVVSHEEMTVLYFDDETITTDDTEGGRIFDRKTGKCLNDSTSFGSKRTIDPQ